MLLLSTLSKDGVDGVVEGGGEGLQCRRSAQCAVLQYVWAIDIPELYALPSADCLSGRHITNHTDM